MPVSARALEPRCDWRPGGCSRSPLATWRGAAGGRENSPGIVLAQLQLAPWRCSSLEGVPGGVGSGDLPLLATWLEDPRRSRSALSLLAGDQEGLHTAPELSVTFFEPFRGPRTMKRALIEVLTSCQGPLEGLKKTPIALEALISPKRIQKGPQKIQKGPPRASQSLLENARTIKIQSLGPLENGSFFSASESSSKLPRGAVHARTHGEVGLQLLTPRAMGSMFASWKDRIGWES